MGFLLSALTGKIGGGIGGDLGKIIMAAVGACLRGESPQDFLKKLAQTHPALRGYNFDDLEGTATSICKQQGKDLEQVKGEVISVAQKYIG